MYHPNRPVWLVCALLLEGCAALGPETGGEVSVGRPQVFTRERLLNERLGEVSWLREQLDLPFEQGFQGFRDVREAAAFALNLQVQYQAAQRRLNALGIADADAQRERDARTAELRQQIVETQLQQQLDALKKQTDSKPPESAVPADLQKDLTRLSDQVSALSAKVDDLASRLTPASTVKGTAATLLDRAPGRLVDPNAVAPTRASLSSRDRLEDEAAFRDLVNSRMREAILDDTHDLKGFTLYELKFDATIVPGGSTRRSAVAELEIQSDKFEWKVDEILIAVHEKLAHRIQEDSNALIQRQQERLASQRFDRTWARRIMSHFNSPSASLACSSRTAKMGYVRPASSEVRAFLDGTPPSNAGVRTWADCMIADYVRHRLQLAIGTYFNFYVGPGSTSNAPDEADRPLLSVEPRTDAREYLACKLNRLRRFAVPWVATVSPKEYAQNISDVMSSQHVRQITAALAAGDRLGSGGTVDIDGYRQEQTVAQGIKRQPLAASFVRGQYRFGWVLGPKYELKQSTGWFGPRETTASFVQTTSRYTFTASVAVPGWFESVCLKGTGYWIESDGRRSAGFPIFGQSADPRSTCQSDEALVHLPNNYRSLFFALLEANFDLFTDPEIFMQRDDQGKPEVVVLRATPEACAFAERGDRTCEQSIVIEGRDLWRNPAVFVGDQRADRVDVLPSMRGIVATWRTLRLPATTARPGRPQDLFVSTSTGQDRVERAVYIATELASVPKPFARLERRMLERTGTAGSTTLDVAFVYPAAAFPRSFSNIALRVRRAGEKDARLFEGEPERSVGRLTYRLSQPEAIGLGERSGEFEVDLVFKLAPGDDWVSLSEPGSRHVIYFSNAAERELTYAGSGRADFSGSRNFSGAELLKLQQALRFDLPADEALFFKAYPGFADALSGRGGEARITMQFDDATAPVELVAEPGRLPNGRRIVVARVASLSAHQLQILPEDERPISYSLGVGYRQGSGDWTPLALKGAAQVTVTGLKKPAPAVTNAGASAASRQ